jgi:hypothetical protein
MGSRGTPLSLADQAGLVILEQLYKKAYVLEYNYMVVLLEGLPHDAQAFEGNLNLSEVDPAEVILKYSAKLEEEKTEAGAKKKGKESGNKRNDLFSLNSLHNYAFPEALGPGRGIPEGVDRDEYIKYRKCLFMDKIRQSKEELVSILSPPAIDHLHHLLTSIYRRNKEPVEKGVFTLQSILMTEFTSSFLITSETFYNNFKHGGFGYRNIDSRMGPTILRSCLLEGRKLTNLALEGVCTDSLLELVGKVATNLKYLNINHSLVTDRGLIDLVGIRLGSAGSRPKLPRTCKPRAFHVERIVKNLNPRWTKIPGQGAVNLVHVEANRLSTIQWPQGHGEYTDYHQVPLDSGFVALLTHLPKLKILMTEVGGKAVFAFIRGRQNKKKFKTEPLELEVLSESPPTNAILDCLAENCPKLRELHVDWSDSIGMPASNRDRWIPFLKKISKLSHLRSQNVDYPSSNLRDTLPVIGHNLVSLHLQDIMTFRYSLTKQIKESCLNLEKFCLMMTSNNILGTGSHILVDKDVDLRLENCSRTNPKRLFSKLKELHLVGPLGCDFVRYTLHGCDHLISLTLGIEWPDFTLCNVTPNSRKDLLGQEFLDEVRGVNSLSELEQIHFFAQHKRGTTMLNRDFALFVASEFKNLKHFGTFKFWNLHPLEIHDVIKAIRQTNKIITFDEDFHEPRVDWRTSCLEDGVDRYPGIKLRRIPPQDRSKLACSWLPMRSRGNTLSILDEVTDMLVAPGVIWGAFDDEDDEVEDEEENSDEDSSDFSDNENFLVDNLGLGGIQDPFCVIQ